MTTTENYSVTRDLWHAMLGLGAGAIIGAILMDATPKTETHYLYRYRPNISTPKVRVQTGTEAAQIDVRFAGWTFSTNVALPKATSIVERLVLVREARSAELAPTVGGYGNLFHAVTNDLDLKPWTVLGKTNHINTEPTPARWVWTKDVNGLDVLIRAEAGR